MNAQIAKDQFTFSLGNASYVDNSYDEPEVTTVKPLQSGWMRRIVAAFAAWRQRQAVMREMEMMTDRELSDIGLSRSDLSRVCDPAFAPDRVRGSDYIAY